MAGAEVVWWLGKGVNDPVPAFCSIILGLSVKCLMDPRWPQTRVKNRKGAGAKEMSLVGLPLLSEKKTEL